MADKEDCNPAFWEPNETGRPLNKSNDWKPGAPVGYIRQDIPAFKIPDYKGETYEAFVPDTLDLQERAALGVHCLTEATDPLADYEIYFFVYFLGNPPMMQHSFDAQCQNKFLEALPLMRIISGSDFNAHVDRRWMEVVLHQLGTDGLAYMPAEGRPWALLGIEDKLPDYAKDLKQYINPFYCGRLLSAMTLYHRRDDGKLWKEAAERLVDGMTELAVFKGDYAYYAPSPYWAERGNTDDPAKESMHSGLEFRGIVLGLTHMYRETGYEPAIKLARKLLNYILKVCHGFDDKGRFCASLANPEKTVDRPQTTHFHMHAYTLLAILEYGCAAGDASLIELARKGYEYGKACGNVLLGYFPEFINSERLEHSELCEVADMIALGLKLTEAGAGDYWDDVDRWARNMLAEGQLTRTDWINRLHTAGLEDTREADVPPSHIDKSYQTTDRVAERCLGAFAGWPKANDWYVGQGMGIMHCCTANAARSIYYLWDHILNCKNGSLRVNLLLNRASVWADIDSHIPYTGRVDVKVKQPLKLFIRIPEWVKPEETRCKINSVKRSLGWDGRYAAVGTVGPGDIIVLTFPIAERTDVVYIEKEKYTLIRKGNEVVKIDPPGKYCPLYQRDHYRTNTTRWKKKKVFVPDEIIHW